MEKWVEVEMPRCGHKRMVAYRAVARLLACHESWIRRLIGRQVTSFDADLYKRIILSEAAADALLFQRARADLARYAGPHAAAALHGEARDAPR